MRQNLTWLAPNHGNCVDCLNVKIWSRALLCLQLSMMRFTWRIHVVSGADIAGEQLAKPAGPEFVMAPTHTITDLLKEGRISSLGQ